MLPDTPGLGLPNHIGMVVKDVDETVKFLSSALGLGPWETFSYSRDRDDMIAGEPFKLKEAKTKLGSVVLELLQPLEDNSLWGQFLKTRGEGLQHIAFVFSNWDEMVSKLQEQGSKMVVCSINPQGKRWAYFDTKPGGLIIELDEA